jgi:hypothetical protein
MHKHLKLGLVVGLAIVLIAGFGLIGGTKFMHSATTPPGSNCISSPDAVVNVTLSKGSLVSSLDTFSPGICFRFLITNTDQNVYDFLIMQPNGGEVLATARTISHGQTVRLDYAFAEAPSWTPVDFVCAFSGQQKPISTEEVYLAK